MFVTVKTNDGDVAAINVANISYITVASFSGHGCRVYFTSKDSLNLRDTMEAILAQIEGDGGTEAPPAPA